MHAFIHAHGCVSPWPQPTSYTLACTRAACHHPAVPHCVPAGVYKATGRNDDNDNTRRPHVEEFARNDGILLADNPLLCLHRPRWSLMAVEGFGSVLGDGSALLRCVCGAPSRLFARATLVLCRSLSGALRPTRALPANKGAGGTTCCSVALRRGCPMGDLCVDVHRR